MDVCAVEHEGKVYLVDETRKVYDIGEPEWTLKHPVGTWDEHRNKPLTSEELHRENRVSLRLEKNKFDMDTARLMGWSEVITLVKTGYHHSSCYFVYRMP